MNQSRKNKKTSFKYIFIAYGIASVIGIIVVLMYDNRHATALPRKTNNQSVLTKTSISTQQSSELALQKLSNEIVSYQLSESESEKLTIEAFNKYYSITTPKSNSNSTSSIEWSEIHDNLLSADQYAKSKSFTLMQSSWQGIGQELSALDGK
ncbi:hypothetical protein [Alicyclobacillus fastidiosus]|uniref:Uncharacterized protein n=1 Tax=Alicyclobacillus fastidiosus TaxID=392011 RepID=A0ABV5AJK7_9BACL|nr:hypothetical protein [Alicyclobacillus fastidiosus]WEH08340.1 hypothetical protein PYS47_16790 [Alicyclobacillus fastidiosus]